MFVADDSYFKFFDEFDVYILDEYLCEVIYN